MTKIYRVLLISIAMGLVFVARAPLAHALPEDEPTGLSGLELRVYPEYDDPRLLVILRGQITGAEASDDPVTVRFLVPSAAYMYSAGYFSQGQYVRGKFTESYLAIPDNTKDDPYPEREASEIAGWDEITFTVETNDFVVEYYDPIIIGNPDKTIAYEFHFRYPVDELEIVIQEPRTSTSFSVDPQGLREVAPVWGEAYPLHFYIYSNLIVDEASPLQFDISYTKSDLRPSLDITDSGGSTLLVVGIVCGVLAAVAVGFFLLRKYKQKSLAARRPVRMSKKKAKRQGFCRQCGKKLDRSTPHCPYCGAKQ